MIEIFNFFKRSVGAYLGLGLFFSLQSGAVEPLYQSPEIDIHWEGSETLSNDEKIRHQLRASEIADFYRTRILASVPTKIWPTGKPPVISVRFRENLPTDGGLFSPPTSEQIGEGTPLRVAVDLSTQLIGSRDAERTLAHEYFHALHWILHPDEPAWLREGLAQLFETRVYAKGKFNTKNLAAGFAEIGTSLQGAMRVDAISAAQYGHVLLYFWYLYGRCGGETLFWAWVNPGEGLFGEKTVDYALKKSGILKPGCRNFEESFVEFELARAINQRSFDEKDPERWFILSSALARPRSEARFPDSARWSRIQPWTAVLTDAVEDRIDPKKLPGVRAFWLEGGSRPKATESFTRPSPKATRVLFLRFPS